ncbi:adenosylcobinamide-phosphate synthase CbiB [Pectinatus haikarae]|uniref:adenosylcobinamide-phosphate synthase CbiB n=1 Tax=Pectinatus haikarae TaxID=349096 RepID=UPI001E4AD64D|nr:adenosylcobinamide-phosphate synthase CbiB [Pectinatus haikarae]
MEINDTMTPAIIAVCAFVIDTIVGDPQSRLHPVALMGRFVNIVENILRRDRHKKYLQIAAGGIFAVFLLFCAYMSGWVIMWGMRQLEVIWWGKLFAESLILSFMISPKSLMQAGQRVINSLRHGDLPEARQMVHYIVGRDVDNMSEQEMVRATVETIAENTTDGIISPLFYFFVGGLPLAILYRMANTLDSMVGYKNEKYFYFGRVSARIDDILNLAPARITGILLVVAAAILHFDYRTAWKMILRDAKKHPSPNGGFTEAAVAGALNIRLGGQNFYFGTAHFRAYMGDAVQQLCPRHVVAAIQLMYTATVLFIALATVLIPTVPTWWPGGF